MVTENMESKSDSNPKEVPSFIIERFLNEALKDYLENDSATKEIKANNLKKYAKFFQDGGLTTEKSVSLLTFDILVDRGNIPIAHALLIEEAAQKLKKASVSKVEPCVKENSFVTVSHLSASGLLSVDKQRCFVRKEWVTLWNDLEATNLFLTGPPGTGKSTLVWAWCLWNASKNKSILWVHINRTLASDIVRFEDGQFVQFIPKEKFTSFPDEISILIVDGVTQDTKELVTLASIWYSSKPTSRKLLIISSMQYNWQKEDYNRLKMKKKTSTGWLYEEYLTACQDEQFYQSVISSLDDREAKSKEEKLVAKFYYAGHSARWMFSENTSETISAISENIDRITSADLLKGFIGDKSLLVVNHLVTYLDGKNNIVVSQYVLKELSKALNLLRRSGM